MKRYVIKTKRKQSGLTLAELLVALMIGSIVLAAAATMADAMSCGKRATEQMARSGTYLAQLHVRLSDLVMCAETLGPRPDNGVTLTYDGGRTIQLYTDNSAQQIIVEEDGRVYSYISDPSQSAVGIVPVGVNRVVIRFDITENGAPQTYTMTVTRRGGQSDGL